jgi:hypothetical protein
MPVPDEGKSEPKPAERDQETVRPMASFEEYLKIREAATAHWRGSDLVFGRVSPGPDEDTLVFIPVQRAFQLATIYRAIKGAKTWRQFKEMIPTEDWNELLVEFQENEWTPDPDEPFECADIPGVEDADWPDWPQQEMMWWLPPKVVAPYAKLHQTVLNGPFLTIDPTRMAEVVEALNRAGHTCFRDDVLVGQACGR